MATTLIGLPPSKINCCVIVTAIWKATFILLISQGGMPAGKITGEHDERFISEKACQEFVERVKKAPGSQVKFRTEQGVQFAKTISHMVECVVSADGQET